MERSLSRRNTSLSPNRIGERASALAESIEELSGSSPLAVRASTQLVRRDSSVQAACMSMVSELELEMKKFDAPSLPPVKDHDKEEGNSSNAVTGMNAAEIVAEQMRSLASPGSASANFHRQSFRRHCGSSESRSSRRARCS